MGKLPRKKREIIGGLVTLAGLAALGRLTDGDESMMLLGSIPFAAFFMWRIRLSGRKTNRRNGRGCSLAVSFHFSQFSR